MDSPDPLFACDGEMAGRMAALDWAATPLGPSESWPQSLRTSVAILLRTRYPMLLSWGEHLVMLYNDAFTATLGTKHPAALGGLLAHEFAEVWEDVGPMQRSVLAGGPPVWFEDLPLNIERGTGPEEAYFTFSYSHVPDESGPGGVLAVLSVTTGKVVAARRLALINELTQVANRAHDPEQAVTAVLAVLGDAVAELSGGAFYRVSGPDSRLLSRVGTFGDTCPAHLLDEVAATDHPVSSAWHGRTTVTGRHACGDSGEVPQLYVALPVRAGDDGGVLVLCPHRLRPFDADHERFATLVADQVGQVLGVASERAREQSRLEALAALDAAKTAFLSNVSHEFRTPLTLLLGPLEDVLGGRSERLAPEDLEVMHSSAHRLLRMVNGLLDVARIEADGLLASPEATDLSELTRDLMVPFESAAGRTGLELETRLDPSIGIVWVDPALWEKILLNLVANALKFTREGSVTVTLTAAQDQIVLRVADTGVGIPESEVGQVFDRFHRVQTGGARSIEGTGIGLALVAEAARAMGGSTGLTSEVGVGSTFEVSLPLVASTEDSVDRWTPQTGAAAALARDAGEDHADVEDQLPSPDPDASVILVAEDNPAMRDRLARILASLGHVVTVPDGRAALERMRAGKVDLLVTDVMMPGLDGLGLLKEVRADSELRSTPVVLLSARAGPEAASGAIEAGADDYVVKPFTTSELLARCRTSLELAQYRAIESAGRVRSALLAGVSHDMQTPLAVITSTLELLSDEEVPIETARHMALRARARAAQLTQLVTQFLDWSRLSMNEPLPLRLVGADLHELAERVVADYEGVALTGDTGTTVLCDPQRTEQILHNLVDNAAKASQSPAIELRVDVEDDLGVARVIDDGPGIGPDVLPRLFEAFSPTDKAGNGLGLHISREAARAQGGDLVLESTGPEGCTFALSVPRALS